MALWAKNESLHENIHWHKTYQTVLLLIFVHISRAILLIHLYWYMHMIKKKVHKGQIKPIKISLSN